MTSGIVTQSYSGAILRIVTHPAFVPGCLLVWVLLRLALILWVPVEPASDAAWYHAKASEISQGLGYLRDGKPTAFWPVGYPGLLAFFYWLFGAKVLVGQFLNLGLSVVTFFLGLDLARRFTSNEVVARLTVLLLALYPNYIAYPSLMMSETLFTTGLLLTIWAYLRFSGVRGAILVGVLCGCITLIKTQALLVAPILIGFHALFVAKGRERLHALGRGAVICFLMLLTILPWSYRNYQVFGDFVLVSTNGGISLLAGNNPSMRPDYRTDFNMDDELVKSLGHPHADELAVDRQAKALARDWLQSHLQRFLGLIPHKIWRLWGPDGEAEWQYQYMEPMYNEHLLEFRAIRVFNQAWYLALILGALAFPILSFRLADQRNRGWVWFSYIFALYTTAISIAFSGQPRYHFPAMSLLAINAAWTAWYLLSTWHAQPDYPTRPNLSTTA